MSYTVGRYLAAFNIQSFAKCYNISGGVNISRPTRTTSLLQKSVRRQRDSITFSCMAKLDIVTTSLQSAIITVLDSDGKLYSLIEQCSLINETAEMTSFCKTV